MTTHFRCHTIHAIILCALYFIHLMCKIGHESYEQGFQLYWMSQIEYEITVQGQTKNENVNNCLPSRIITQDITTVYVGRIAVL